jgi:Bacterial protein of unknown function (DUF899)
MPEGNTGTREEWHAARDELAKLEGEHAELGRKVIEQRRRLPYHSFLLARTPKPEPEEPRAWRKDEYPD